MLMLLVVVTVFVVAVAVGALLAVGLPPGGTLGPLPRPRGGTLAAPVLCRRQARLLARALAPVRLLAGAFARER
jgi:hypothetical protein